MIIYLIRTKSILCKKILFYFTVLIKNDPKPAFNAFLIKNTVHFPFLSVPAPIFRNQISSSNLIDKTQLYQNLPLEPP